MNTNKTNSKPEEGVRGREGVAWLAQPFEKSA